MNQCYTNTRLVCILSVTRMLKWIIVYLSDRVI